MYPAMMDLLAKLFILIGYFVVNKQSMVRILDFLEF